MTYWMSSPFVVAFLCCLLPERSQSWSNPPVTKTRKSRWKRDDPRGSCRLTTSSSSPPPSIPTADNKSNDDTSYVVPFLGQVYRLGGGGDGSADDRSFVDRMGVPTFAALVDGQSAAAKVINGGQGQRHQQTNARSIEAIQPGPAVVVPEILSADVCRDMIAACESLGFADYQAGKNHHGALQLIVSRKLVHAVATRLEPHVDVAAVQALQLELMKHRHDGTKKDDNLSATTITTTTTPLPKLQFSGLNRRWRVYRYAPGGVQSFAPHIDASFPPSGLSANGQDLEWDISNGRISSRLTLLLYLNDDFEGGETVFYPPAAAAAAATGPSSSTTALAAIRPQAGAALIFPQAVGQDAVDYARQHWPLHEGSPVLPLQQRQQQEQHQKSSPKYVIRSDIMFQDSTEQEDKRDT